MTENAKLVIGLIVFLLLLGIVGSMEYDMLAQP